MRKMYILLLSVMVVTASFAQQKVDRLEHIRSFKKATTAVKTVKSKVSADFYFEDFQSQTIPIGMTILNEDGNALPPNDFPKLTEAWVVLDNNDNYFALSTSFTASPKADDWMITPQISITTGAYLEWDEKLEFGWGGTTQEYEVLVTNSIAGSTPVASDFVDVIYSKTMESSYWETVRLDLQALGYINTDIWVAFRNISAGESDPDEIDILEIDNIKVYAPKDVNAGLESITTPFIHYSTLDIIGVIKNYGLNSITSFDLTYNIDGGTESAVYTVTDVNIPIGDTIHYAFDVPYTFGAIGSYEIEVTIGNVNGIVDEDQSNNSLTKPIIIGEDNDLKKTTLMEFFGSNNLPLGEGGMYDMYATAFDLFDEFYFAELETYTKASLITYQLDPDPYQTQECIDRFDYYDVAKDPAFYGDGEYSRGYVDLYNIPYLYDNPAFFDISVNQTFSGDSITVDVSILPYANVDAICHIAVVEKVTTENVGESAVAEYKNVLMKMLPDVNGTAVSLTSGVTYTFSETYDMSSTNAEEVDDLLAIVYLQDNASKYVYQSAFAQYNNLTLQSVEIPLFHTPGSVKIGGTVKNTGILDSITSYDVVYSINGGLASAVYSVTDVDIDLGETHDFVHNVPYTFTSDGKYNVSVTISNISGGIAEAEGDNTLDQDIVINSNARDKMALIETFTSNDNSLYDLVNSIIDSVRTLPENENKSALITYPYDPDPYFVGECELRAMYYKLTSLPRTYGNGDMVRPTDFTTEYLKSLYEDDKAFFDISGYYRIDGYNIEGELTIDPVVSHNAICHVAIVEKTTVFNNGASGQEEFHNVVMRMLPAYELSDEFINTGYPPEPGTEMNLIAGKESTLSFEYDMSTTNVEEMGDLAVVVFLQDKETKQVLQTIYADDVTSVDDIQNTNLVRLYPNPSKGLLYLETEESSSVSIYNVLGERVKYVENINSSARIDISNQPEGTYIIKVETKDCIIIKKVVLTK